MISNRWVKVNRRVNAGVFKTASESVWAEFSEFVAGFENGPDDLWESMKKLGYETYEGENPNVC